MTDLQLNGSTPTEYEVAGYRILRLDPDLPGHKEIFYKLVVRALGFIDRYGAETSQQWLVNLLYGNFTRERKTLIHLLVALDSSNNIVGHSIAFIDDGGRLGNVIHILQAENDVAKP